MSSIYLISGVPCCLKTKFGDWLRDNRGFLHIDMETNFDTGPFHPMWAKSLPNDIQSFADALKPIHPRIVLTWGYPIKCLPWIPQFQNAGVQSWWFDGDVDLARSNWIGRQGREPQGSEQQQFNDIKANHAAILSQYGDRVVETLKTPANTYLPLEEIADRLHIPPYP